MAGFPSQYPIGRARNASTADSVVDVREEIHDEKEPLYGDLKSYLIQKRHYWLFTRDVELARPLQERFLAFEAEVMGEIHEVERAKEIIYRKQARDMDGAVGLTKMSWKLYQLKVRMCSQWTHYQLHCRRKRRHLDAKKKELSEEYVRAQMGTRIDMLKDVIYFANEEGVENGDDGGYVRDGILNYIVTGYDSIFPILRHLELESSRI